jgi:hypothetical protein
VDAPAALYPYILPDGTSTNAFFEGTSFAAPVISVMAALQLTVLNPQCPFDVQAPWFARNESWTSVPRSSVPTLDDIRLGKWTAPNGSAC